MAFFCLRIEVLFQSDKIVSIAESSDSSSSKSSDPCRHADGFIFCANWSHNDGVVQSGEMDSFVGETDGITENMRYVFFC